MDASCEGVGINHEDALMVLSSVSVGCDIQREIIMVLARFYDEGIGNHPKLILVVTLLLLNYAYKD